MALSSYRQDQERMEKIAQRALFLLKRSPTPQQDMQWADQRLREESLLGSDPDPKDPTRWTAVAIAQNLDLMEVLPYLQEKGSYPEKAPTFENLILSLIPSEGGL